MEELRMSWRRFSKEKKRPFKVDFSFGFALRHWVMGDLRYYYASRNNNLVLHTPILVKERGDLGKVLRKLEEVDPLDYAYRRKPNSQWVVVRVTNITWFITDVPGAGLIGSCCCGDGGLPRHIKNNHGLHALERGNSGRAYRNDWMCFFRCLALYEGASILNLELKAKRLRRRASFRTNKDYSGGVSLADLPDLEKIFGVDVFVYSLCDDGSGVDLVRRSLGFHRTRQMYVNLWESLFLHIRREKNTPEVFLADRARKVFQIVHVTIATRLSAKSE